MKLILVLRRVIIINRIKQKYNNNELRYVRLQRDSSVKFQDRERSINRKKIIWHLRCS